MRYTDYQQWQLDIASGEEFDKAMVKAGEHYHRIETAPMQEQTPDEVQYNLTRLEGQIFRLRTLLASGTVEPDSAIRDILYSSEKFLAALRTALSGIGK